MYNWTNGKVYSTAPHHPAPLSAEFGAWPVTFVWNASLNFLPTGSVGITVGNNMHPILTLA